MDVRKQFGKTVKLLRQQRRFTQEELAYRAGMDVTYLSDLERGKWNPSLAMIVDLGRGLEVHPSKLLEGIELGPSQRPSRKRGDP